MSCLTHFRCSIAVLGGESHLSIINSDFVSSRSKSCCCRLLVFFKKGVDLTDHLTSFIQFLSAPRTNSWGPWWGEAGHIRVHEPNLFVDDIDARPTPRMHISHDPNRHRCPNGTRGAVRAARREDRRTVRTSPSVGEPACAESPSRRGEHTDRSRPRRRALDSTSASSGVRPSFSSSSRASSGVRPSLSLSSRASSGGRPSLSASSRASSSGRCPSSSLHAACDVTWYRHASCSVTTSPFRASFPDAELKKDPRRAPSLQLSSDAGGMRRRLSPRRAPPSCTRRRSARPSSRGGTTFRSVLRRIEGRGGWRATLRERAVHVRIVWRTPLVSCGKRSMG